MTKDYEKKIRIQLFDTDFNQISDRLLGQDLELKSGPKQAHKGPLKVEVSLFSAEDVTLLKEYLDRLSGTLPIVEKKKKGRKKITAGAPDFAESILEAVDGLSTGTEVLAFLADQGFVYTTVQYIGDLELPVQFPVSLELTNYRILIRLIKKAKNPLNHKYDPTMVILVDKTELGKFTVIQFGEVTEEYDLEPGDKKSPIIPKTNLTKFPHYMIQEERNKFRVERDKLIADPTRKPTKFYERWVHMVNDQNVGKGLELPRINEIEKPY